MRRACAAVGAAVGVFFLLSAALAVPLPPDNAPWPDAALRWIKAYRSKPDPMAASQLMRALSRHSGFKDPEASGIYIGFFAGVLNENPRQAWSLIEKTLPLPFEDQWVPIRALAYSNLPEWRSLMSQLAQRIPDRRVMAERYMGGELPALSDVPLEPVKPGAMEKVANWFRADKKAAKRAITFASSPELIDTMWGLYYATGDSAPIERILVLLPWSKERDSVEKLTIGSMAKFTLASNAARDAGLLKMLKRLEPAAPADVKPVLNEVIEAAEIADTVQLGKEAMAALEELKRKGPGSTRDLLSWGSAGEALLSLGCLGLAVGGQVAAGIPCVVGGALTTGGLRYLGRSD